MVRGPDGSKCLLQAGHCSSRLLSGAMNTSKACAFISTDAPRYATDTMRPPLGVSRTSSRDWQFGQRTFAGSVDVDVVATSEIVVAKLRGRAARQGSFPGCPVAVMPFPSPTYDGNPRM